MLVVDRRGAVRYMNPTLQNYCGLVRDRLLGYLNSQPLSEGHLQEFAIEGENGQPLNLELHAAAISWEGEAVLLITVRDISERRRAERRMRLAASVMAATMEGIFVTDNDFRIIETNPAFTDITGLKFKQARGQTPVILAAGHYEEEKYLTIRNIAQTSDFWQGEVWNRRTGGDVYAAWLTINAIKNGQGETSGFVGVFTDITQRKLLEEHLQHMAHYDVLTGLPNRALFLDRLGHALPAARRNGHSLALLFLDLDKFKPVNDRLGHDAGDALLREVAARLKEQVRESDTVARLGGDEFVVLLHETDGDGAAHIALKILAALTAPFYPKDEECRVGVSVGISLFPQHGDDKEGLLERADAAMYLAKKEPGQKYRIFGD